VPRRRQAVPGAIEGHEERFWISHGGTIPHIGTESQ
jgi:hypothetical protein